MHLLLASDLLLNSRSDLPSHIFLIRHNRFSLLFHLFNLFSLFPLFPLFPLHLLLPSSSLLLLLSFFQPRLHLGNGLVDLPARRWAHARGGAEALVLDAQRAQQPLSAAGHPQFLREARGEGGSGATCCEPSAIKGVELREKKRQSCGKQRRGAVFSCRFCVFNSCESFFCYLFARESL